jgi:hypothetical protein
MVHRYFIHPVNEKYYMAHQGIAPLPLSRATIPDSNRNAGVNVWQQKLQMPE